MLNAELVSPYLSLFRSRFSESKTALLDSPGLVPLQALDTEVKSIELALTEARSLRNLATHTHRLPPEVLVNIFEELQLSWKPSRESIRGSSGAWYPGRYKSGWMSVTHICSYWREIALGASVLWSNATIDVLAVSPKFIPELFLRTHGDGVHLELRPANHIFHIGALDREPAIQAWFSPLIIHCYTKSLTIAGKEDVLSYAAARLLPRMPQLHTLDLFHTSFGLEPAAPEPFGMLSNVMDLTLQRCNLPLDSPVFSGHLKRFRKLSTGKRLQDPYVDWQPWLSGMTSLKYLYLENTVPCNIPDDGKGPTTTLPSSLRIFRFRVSSFDHVLDGLRFLSRVRSPANCSLDYDIHPSPELLDDPQYTSTLGQVLFQLSSPREDESKARHLVLGCKSVVIASDEPLPSCPHINSWTSTPLYANDVVVHRLVIQADYYAPQSYDLSAALSFLAMDELRAIILTPESIHYITTNALWHRLLRAKVVHRVDMQAMHQPLSTHFSDLRSALCQHYDTGTNGDILFPHLRILALHLLEHKDETQDFDFVTALLELVRARKELGVPLKEIVVIGKCSLEDEVWDNVRAEVEVTVVGR